MDIPKKFVIEAFVNSLSIHEADILIEILQFVKKIPSALQCDVLGVLNYYDWNYLKLSETFIIIFSKFQEFEENNDW